MSKSTDWHSGKLWQGSRHYKGCHWMEIRRKDSSNPQSRTRTRGTISSTSQATMSRLTRAVTGRALIGEYHLLRPSASPALKRDVLTARKLTPKPSSTPSRYAPNILNVSHPFDGGRNKRTTINSSLPSYEPTRRPLPSTICLKVYISLLFSFLGYYILTTYTSDNLPFSGLFFPVCLPTTSYWHLLSTVLTLSLFCM